MDFEKKLDETIMRKKLDIQESLGKPAKVRRTLRLFVSNQTATPNDEEQISQGKENTYDLSNNAPSWTLKIEGGLLDTAGSDKVEPAPKMTSFFRSISVELDRDPNTYPEGNLIEWQKQPNTTTDYDMIEIKRKGDMNVNCRISLYLEHNPQKYKLSPILADLLDTQLDTKLQIVMGIWSYCKAHKLQDHEDKRIIRCDPRLTQIFGYPQVHFSQIPELINQHLTRPDPVVIEYTIRYVLYTCSCN
ncbi:SWIB/MDM2 domain-containing protein [Sporodiniella umbellata]|nr:SWIB/MDM2 domain-containing protein [Sporodiniella umbellata]